MKAFAADYDKFRAAGAEILGVSQDQVSTQRRFRLHCATPFPFLSDAGGKVSKLYGVQLPAIKLTRRVTFLIDQGGIVREVVEGMPKNAALLASLAAWDTRAGEATQDVSTP